MFTRRATPFLLGLLPVNLLAPYRPLVSPLIPPVQPYDDFAAPWAYWCSSPGLTGERLEGRATSLKEAFLACARHSGERLDWVAVDDQQWSAEHDHVVYTVRLGG